MYRSDEEFSNWYDYKATPDERELAEKVEEFGELFKDMLFKKGTCTFDMIKEIDLQGGKQAMSTQEEIECFEYYHYYYSVEPLEDCDAYYNHGELTLCVSPEALNEDSTILHEMIHLHEALINDLPLYYHDMIIWALYKSLKERIPALDDIITGHAYLLTGTKLYARGGLHDILILLKSFDLDIRMDYPLGTVFAYGKSDELKGYDYLK